MTLDDFAISSVPSIQITYAPLSSPLLRSPLPPCLGRTHPPGRWGKPQSLPRPSRMHLAPLAGPSPADRRVRCQVSPVRPRRFDSSPPPPADQIRWPRCRHTSATCPRPECRRRWARARLAVPSDSPSPLVLRRQPRSMCFCPRILSWRPFQRREAQAWNPLSGRADLDLILPAV